MGSHKKLVAVLARAAMIGVGQDVVHSHELEGGQCRGVAHTVRVRGWVQYAGAICWWVQYAGGCNMLGAICWEQ